MANPYYVAVHLSVYGPLAVHCKPLLLAGGELLSHWGPMQRPTPLNKTTIGALRSEWGMEELGAGLPPATECWWHSTDEGDGGVTVVLVAASSLQ